MNAEGTVRLRTSVELMAASYAVGGKPILQPLTMRLTEQRIGIIGRNGSGKTTLARMIAGLITPDSGKVRVAGLNVAQDRRQAISAVGILFQNPDHQIIFPTVKEELAFGLSQLGLLRDEAETGAVDMLDRFGRAAWADRPVHQLSQGQRHLVCLMAVLAMGPQTIILDEPFAGLDIPTTNSLFRELMALDQQILLITHMAEMLVDFDRVIWIEGGAIAADGSPETVVPTYQKAMMREGMDDLSDL